MIEEAKDGTFEIAASPGSPYEFTLDVTFVQRGGSWEPGKTRGYLSGTIAFYGETDEDPNGFLDDADDRALLLAAGKAVGGAKFSWLERSWSQAFPQGWSRRLTSSQTVWTEVVAGPHDADVKGHHAVITRAADDRPPAHGFGANVSKTVKIAKRQGQERDLMSDSKTKFGGKVLDETRTARGRAMLAETRKARINELASVMDYLVKRALADPRDHEARELAVRSLLANHESLDGSRIAKLLAPVERAITQTVAGGTAEAAATTLRSHGFKDITEHGLLASSLDANEMKKLAPKFAHVEAGWLKVADHRETTPGHDTETDTTGGFSSGPELHEVTVFRTPSGHVARVLSAALIAGAPYVLSVQYLHREGF